MLLFIFAFLSGLVTILAPCIWPILPIVLSASSAGGGGRKRSLGITLGVMTSFTIFLLSISFLARVFNINPSSLRLVAAIVIGLMAVMMIVPKLAAQFEILVSRLANVFGQKNNSNNSGFKPGFLTGLSLGLVWSPCAGPILATIAALAATGGITLQAVGLAVSYVAGVGVPLFAFAYGGQRFLSKSRLVNKFTGKIQRVFGVVMLVMAFVIYKNYDVVLQAKILERVPVLARLTTGFETSDTVQKEIEKLTGRVRLDEGVVAPEFVGITRWLNLADGRQSLSLSELKGKVVLVDFWTYTCINCVRTLPHVTAWYDTYKDDGFAVIGMHTPEFAFEKETKNVLTAIERFKINYPVAQDNDFATWNAYSNQYWPAHYLIDATGKIRYTHFGEGKYEETEAMIRTLLAEAGKSVDRDMTVMPDETPRQQASPETYLGSRRMLYLDKIGKASQGEQTFVLNPEVAQNRFSLGGVWNIGPESATAVSNAVLIYEYRAKDVFLVLRPGSGGAGTVKVFVDGVARDTLTVDSDRLYEVVRDSESGDYTLRLEFSPGVQGYAFTFG